MSAGKISSMAVTVFLWVSALCAGPAETALFNGISLDGWKFHLADPKAKMEGVWSVRDGTIICKGEPLGYLYTAKSYTNFKLSVEWRWAPGTKPGNSGVLMRINGEPRTVPRSIEAQLKSGNAGDVYGFHGMKIAGEPARSRTQKAHELLGDFIGVTHMMPAEKQPGEWNRYDITLNGGNLSVSINGKKVNEVHDCDVVAGPIGLQSEGGEIHFRLVRLTPIP
jgi:hypothetical protein